MVRMLLLRAHSILLKPNPATLTLPLPSPSVLRGRNTSRLLCSSNTSAGGMEDKQQPSNKNPGDEMSHSFGEGYSTRSEEEGFGGIYPDNQQLRKEDPHDIHPEYDQSQGSEVKEKEKGRNQKDTATN